MSKTTKTTKAPADAWEADPACKLLIEWGRTVDALREARAAAGRLRAAAGDYAKGAADRPIFNRADGPTRGELLAAAEEAGAALAEQVELLAGALPRAVGEGKAGE